ncbi:MAG: hydroxyphenylacetyl-CoA thioesterase PaaI [Acidimicrobiales bacterium]
MTIRDAEDSAGAAESSYPAKAVADAMFANDAASRSLGIEIVDVGYGTATLTMTVRPDMVNGLDVCHGGFIFTLADSAMAFSSNSFNTYAIATHAEVDWVNPGRLGAVLTAAATQRYQRGRNAITDAVITDDAGEVVAHFRGRTRQVKGQHLG